MSEPLVIPIALTEKQYLQSLARLERATLGAANKFEKGFAQSTTRGMRGVSSSARGASNSMRMFGQQMSQVVSQGSMLGGVEGYFRALAIQGADLGLMFGTVGIAAGALASAIGPIAADMLFGAESSKELEKSLKALDAAMARLNDTQGRAGSNIFDLQDKYGGLADSARQLFEIEREIAQLRATEAVRATTRDVAGGLGVAAAMGIDPESVGRISEAVRELRDEQEALQQSGARGSDEQLRAANERIAAIKVEISALREVQDGVDDLQDMLGLTEEQAAQVAQRFAELGQIDGADAQARAMSDLVEYISEATGNLADADEEGRKLYDSLVEAVAAAFDLAAIDIAGNIGTAADEAERLTRALDRFMRMNPTTAAMMDEDAAMGVPVLQTSTTRDAIRRGVEREQDRLARETARGGAASGSASSKRENELLRERDRILRSIETANEKYHRDLVELDKVKAAGLLTGEQYNRALAELNDDLVNAEFGQVIQGIEDVSDALGQALVNSESLGEGVGNVLKQIAADIISSGIKNLLLDTFNIGTRSSGGGIGGFLGNIFGGLFGRAGGGQVMAGTPYRVNEGINSEVFAPAVNGRILSVQQAQEAMGGGGGNPTRVIVEVQTSEDLVATARQAGGVSGGQVALTVMQRQSSQLERIADGGKRF